MQFGRYKTQTHTSLPIEWTEELTKILTEIYAERSEKNNRFFYVHGEVCDKEFVVIVSYVHRDDPMSSPITLFLSHDIIEDSKVFQRSLKDLVDLTGEIFDNILSQPDWCDYLPNWTENKYKSAQFFYKITRENISLTLQAEEILAKDAMSKI